MSIQVIAGAAAVMAAVPLLIWGLIVADRQRGQLVRRNLDSGGQLVDARMAVLQQPALQRALRPTIRGLAVRVRRLSPVGWVESIERRLRHAGSPRAWSLERVLAAKLILFVVGAVFGIYVLTYGGGFAGVLVFLGAPLLGYFAPDGILYGRARERQTAIQDSLADSLDHLSINVEAGLGFDSALQRVAESGSGPMAAELERMLGELNVGVSRRQSFTNLLERTDVPELRHFVFAVQQADEYGIPIAKVLRIQASELRLKRRQAAEERAMRTQVKIIFPLVLCIFPTMFIVLLGPAAIRMSRALFSG